jgi:hypothetical protein
LIIVRPVMEAMAFVAYYLVPIINEVAVPVANTIPVGAEMPPGRREQSLDRAHGHGRTRP